MYNYSYDGDSIYCADTGVDGVRTLYETGIYEVFIGMRGVALFDYYQFKEDQRQAEFVIGLTQDYEDGKYYKNMEAESSDNIEITEEEFWEIREQYEKNLIELLMRRNMMYNCTFPCFVIQLVAAGET